MYKVVWCSDYFSSYYSATAALKEAYLAHMGMLPDELVNIDELPRHDLNLIAVVEASDTRELTVEEVPDDCGYCICNDRGEETVLTTDPNAENWIYPDVQT